MTDVARTSNDVAHSNSETPLEECAREHLIMLAAAWRRFVSLQSGDVQQLARVGVENERLRAMVNNAVVNLELHGAHDTAKRLRAELQQAETKP